MRELSYAVNSQQTAALMRKITKSYEALKRTEVRARDACLSATEKLTDSLADKNPNGTPRYSSDPLLSIATYPIGFHLLMLTATEIQLRVLLERRGFDCRCVGPVSYYYLRGRNDLQCMSNLQEYRNFLL
jgi:hypothetical protein